MRALLHEEVDALEAEVAALIEAIERQLARRRVVTPDMRALLARARARLGRAAALRQAMGVGGG